MVTVLSPCWKAGFELAPVMLTGLVVKVQTMLASSHPDGTVSENLLKWSLVVTSKTLHCASLRLKEGKAPEPLAQVNGDPVPPAGIVALQMVMVCAACATAAGAKAAKANTSLRSLFRCFLLAPTMASSGVLIFTPSSSQTL